MRIATTLNARTAASLAACAVAVTLAVAGCSQVRDQAGALTTPARSAV
ncbi:MAG: hypothetical protein HHJ14_02680, partial [Cellulomonas sp.]|nr:hypothetical protein [Cellulomonas sp.]